MAGRSDSRRCMCRFAAMAAGLAALACNRGGPTAVPVAAALNPAAEAAPPADSAPLGTRKAGSDWPRFLGPLGNGVSPEKGILTRWPADGLRLVWQAEVGEGYSAPVVADG